MAFEVLALRHWLGGKRVKAEQRVAGLFEAIGDGPMPEPPLADEALRRRSSISWAVAA